MDDAAVFDAVIFDFDGLILDTEMPLYLAWADTDREFGCEPITIQEWTASIGRHELDALMLDPHSRLISQLPTSRHAHVDSHRRLLNDRLLAEADLCVGVTAWLDAAERRGLPTAIATSSPLDWIEEHLVPRDLMRRFAQVVCAGGEIPGKPDPAVCRLACDALEVAPSRALALEDSPKGVAAAKAAGLFCIAVPCSLTAGCDFTAADVVATSASSRGDGCS